MPRLTTSSWPLTSVTSSPLSLSVTLTALAGAGLSPGSHPEAAPIKMTGPKQDTILLPTRMLCSSAEGFARLCTPGIEALGLALSQRSLMGLGVKQGLVAIRLVETHGWRIDTTLDSFAGSKKDL